MKTSRGKWSLNQRTFRGEMGYFCSIKNTSSGFFLILMQIKGSTVLHHCLENTIDSGRKEPFGNCQWQEDREEGDKKPTMLYEGSVASSPEQPLSI